MKSYLALFILPLITLFYTCEKPKPQISTEKIASELVWKVIQYQMKIVPKIFNRKIIEDDKIKATILKTNYEKERAAINVIMSTFTDAHMSVYSTTLVEGAGELKTNL